jgi:hypothetical protein
MGGALFESWPGHRRSWLRFSWFSSFHPRKLHDNTSIRPRSLPSKSFPVHHDVTLPFDAVLYSYWLPTASKVIRKINKNTTFLIHIQMVKSRMRWAGYVERMGDKESAYRVLVRKLEGKRPLGRPRHRREDNAKTDLREIRRGDMD